MKVLSRIASMPGTTGALACCAALFAGANSASAGFLDPFIVVTASNAGGTGTYTVAFADTSPGATPGSRVFLLPATVDIMDGLTLIARIHGLNSMVAPQVGAIPNVLSLGFTVEAGSSDTTFTIDSTLFPIAPNVFDAARINPSWNAQDQNDNGLVVTGLNPGGFAYRAAYDGQAPGGTQFAAALLGLAAGSGGNDSASITIPPAGFTSLGVAAADMSARWQFLLSAGDSAGATSGYFIIPAPGAAGLLGIAGLFLIRRARD
jgi:hypothetical protein